MKTQFIKTPILIILLLAVLVLLPVVIAETNIQSLGTFKKGEGVNLVQNCINSTYSNITRITYPNGTFIINTPTAMIKNGDDYSYLFNNTSTTGQYLVYGTCDENLQAVNWVYDFQITPSGFQLATGQSLLYIIALIIAIGIFLMLLYPSLAIPFRNLRTEEGKVISINNLKWLKIGAIAIDYIILMFIFAISMSIFDNFLYVIGIGRMFEWLYNIMLAMMFPLAILAMILGFMIFLIDLTQKKKLKRRHYR